MGEILFIVGKKKGSWCWRDNILYFMVGEIYFWCDNGLGLEGGNN